MNKTFLFVVFLSLFGCSSKTTYENEVMPTGAWQPINQNPPQLLKTMPTIKESQK